MSKSHTKYQARRPLPRLRTKARARTEQQTLTLGDLIAAAYDTVGDDTRAVARLLQSNAMAARIGRHLVID